MDTICPNPESSPFGFGHKTRPRKCKFAMSTVRHWWDIVAFFAYYHFICHVYCMNALRYTIRIYGLRNVDGDGDDDDANENWTIKWNVLHFLLISFWSRFFFSFCLFSVIYPNNVSGSAACVVRISVSWYARRHIEQPPRRQNSKEWEKKRRKRNATSNTRANTRTHTAVGGDRTNCAHYKRLASM